MAQYRTDKKIIDSGQVTSRYEVQMMSDQLTPSGTMIDAFGRLRISNPFTIFDSTLRYTDDTRNWSISTTGGANTSHNVNRSSVSMNVGTTSGDKAIRQTKRYFFYQPGKSLMIMNTFNMQPKANVRQRVGYFSDRDGIFMEHDGATTYIVKRSYTTGSVVETKIPQSEWSEDKFDGTGYSKVTLDLTKTQIQWMDIEWLGAGTVRVGFVVNGVFYTAHKFHHANLITSVYMTTASLPIRYEIENTGTAASATSLDHICNTVISEGGYTPRVSTRSVSTALTGINISNIEQTPIMAIRLKTDRSGGVVVPVACNLYGLQNTPFNYSIIQAATITGGTWVSSSIESHVEYNITPTSFTGGRVLLKGMFIGGTAVSVTDVDFKKYDSAYQLRTNIDGSMETFLIAVQATTNNDKAISSLTWEEYN